MDALWLVVVVAAVLVSVLSLWATLAEARRRRALASAARRAGLHFSAEGSIRLPPFEVFRQGDEQGTENVMTRPAAPGQPAVFDFWWAEVHRDEHGREQRTYTRRTAALIEAGWLWPSLAITREGLVTRAAKALGVRDIEYESEEFNRAFWVRCDDHRFAQAFVDAQMIDFLLSTRGLVDVEVGGRWVAVHTARLAGHELPALLRLVEALRDRIPPVVHELWPVPTPTGEARA